MTQKEMKETLENIDLAHCWTGVNDSGFSNRVFYCRVFDDDLVLVELEQYWVPPTLPGRPDGRNWSPLFYYFIKGGAKMEYAGHGTAGLDLLRPLSHYRKSKTEVLNLLKEAGRTKA